MRLLRGIRPFCLCGLTALALAAVLTACSTRAPSASNGASNGAPSDATNYLTGILRVSDHLKIDITGTPETIEPIETDIKDDGTVSLHFLDRFPAAGKTPGQLEKDIQAALVPKIYAHCNVTVTPTGLYCYLVGEVVQSSLGGRIPLSGPITVTQAIATAGGFSPFANKRKVRLTRVDGTVIIVNCHKANLHKAEDPLVYPGDTIFITRRF